MCIRDRCSPPTRRRARPPRVCSSCMLDAALCVVRRDLLLAWRRKSDVATALLFFVIVTSLFPLGVGAEPPGVVVVRQPATSTLVRAPAASDVYQSQCSRCMLHAALWPVLALSL